VRSRTGSALDGSDNVREAAGVHSSLPFYALGCLIVLPFSLGESDVVSIHNTDQERGLLRANRSPAVGLE
jgi:hypothetical protein